MFLVIDGSALLSTHFYGHLPADFNRNFAMAKTDAEKERLYKNILHTDEGVYTNGIYGALKAILNIVEYQKPDYIVVCLDKSRNTFRKKMYQAYKENRSEKPMPLKQQMPVFMRALRYIGIPVLFADDYEADDLAGSVIRKFEDKQKMIFMTKDHDYLQLIDRNVSGWMMQNTRDNVEALAEKYYTEFGIKLEDLNQPNKVFEFTTRQVRGEMGVNPNQIIDLKALIGDTADNIPGVHGVGETSAVPLLQKYKTVENLYKVVDQSISKAMDKNLSLMWRKELGISKSPLNALKKYKDMCFLSKELATIKTDCDVPGDIDWYKCHVDMEMLEDVCESLEFNPLEFVS